MTFDWDKVLVMIAKLGSSWIDEADKITPRAISVHALTTEAHIWQQILANYMIPSIHETYIIVDMVVLV
ncbi:hypothetical protein AHAS_Ahas09G0167000 [Arachis hypogaea]